MNPVNRLKYGGDQGKTPIRDNPMAKAAGKKDDRNSP